MSPPTFLGLGSQKKSQTNKTTIKLDIALDISIGHGVAEPKAQEREYVQGLRRPLPALGTPGKAPARGFVAGSWGVTLLTLHVAAPLGSPQFPLAELLLPPCLLTQPEWAKGLSILK